MNSSKLIDVFKDGNVVIPIYLMKNYKLLKLNCDEFLFLMYLYNLGDNSVFDPEKMSVTLNIDLNEIMMLVSSLSEKNMIKVDVKKNEKGFMEDVVSLDGFFNKLKLLFMEDVNENRVSKKNDTTVYEMIEKEFGRTLSSIEYEIIKAWLDNNISEELIGEALKEAVFNGVSNLKYIDKILYEWGKKGFTSVEDVENNRRKRNTQKDKELDLDKDIDMDIMDWNWFDDE